MIKKAFTLVELMIVVAVLGILAAIVLPSLQAHTTQAKEAVAKDMLRLMRNQISLYKHNHNDALPGTLNGTETSNTTVVKAQFTNCTNITGTPSAASTPSGAFIYGPYVLQFPENPFNELATMKIVADVTAFSAAADGTSSGWLYKISTGEIAVNSTGTDSDSVKHYDY